MDDLLLIALVFTVPDRHRRAAVRGGRGDDDPGPVPDRHPVHADGPDGLQQPDAVPAADHPAVHPGRPPDGGGRHGDPADRHRHQPGRVLPRQPRPGDRVRLHDVRRAVGLGAGDHGGDRLGHHPGDEAGRLFDAVRGGDRGVGRGAGQPGAAQQPDDHLRPGLGDVDPPAVPGRVRARLRGHGPADGRHLLDRAPAQLRRHRRPVYPGGRSSAPCGPANGRSARRC